MREPIDIINERPLARPCDQSTKQIIGELSLFIMRRDWRHLGDVEVGTDIYSVIRHRNEPVYRAGYITPSAAGKPHFATVFHIILSAVKNHHFKDKGMAMGYPDLHNVNLVGVADGVIGTGIARTMYKWLVGQGILLLGDREQYFEARRLWARLSKEFDVVVDIVDYVKLIVLKRDIVLHHGEYDDDFDREVWSRDDSLEHIRLVLRGVT